MRAFFGVAALAAAGVLAGCGGESGPSGPPPQPPPPPPPPPTTAPTTTSTAPTQTTALRVYFFAQGKLATATRAVPQTAAVATAALRALAAGPDGFERSAGYETTLPAGTTFAPLTIDGGVARLDLPAGLSEAARAQIVYTLTQSPTVQAVEAGGARLTRAAFESLTPQILVEEPTPGQTISSPVRIRGTANTFEATFVVRLLLNAAGAEAFETAVTATSGSGTRGTFDVSVPYKVTASGPGTLVAFEQSAEDGSEIHRVEIPVNVTP